MERPPRRHRLLLPLLLTVLLTVLQRCRAEEGLGQLPSLLVKAELKAVQAFAGTYVPDGQANNAMRYSCCAAPEGTPRSKFLYNRGDGKWFFTGSEVNIGLKKGSVRSVTRGVLDPVGLDYQYYSKKAEK